MSIKNISWIIFRIVLLNGFSLLLVALIMLMYNVIEYNATSFVYYNYPLLIITLFLSNIVYFVGNGLEALYSKLWDLKKELKTREKQFFRIGIVMALIVNVTATILYILQ